jgi:hypothetical protein
MMDEGEPAAIVSSIDGLTVAEVRIIAGASPLPPLPRLA